MVPTPLHSPRSSRLIVTILSVLSQYVPNIARKLDGTTDEPFILHTYAKRATAEPHSTEFIVFACLIPVLVLLSGIFAGLTLGYMSLDETQLNVLSISGTPQQKLYAAKIKPIRENGHLLLVTLLLANMIVNETLPIISDPVLGGSAQSVVVSTVLIVMYVLSAPSDESQLEHISTLFSPADPSSTDFPKLSRNLFAVVMVFTWAPKMAGFTRVLICLMGVVAWPVAKLVEFVLGPHHGIIYRRAELKELIAMHSMISAHGGDLNTDTVTIIGATLDLQEKVVKQAMTPINDVFMLSIDSKLDYDTMKTICMTGHSQKVKKIVGILLVKHCVMLDPKDAVPLRRIPLNKVPFVPNNESLLGDSSDSSDEEDPNLKANTKDSKENSKGVSWADDSEKGSTIQGDTITDFNNVEQGVQATSMVVKNGIKQKRRHRQRKMDIESEPVGRNGRSAKQG
ncbi:hypothetical protein JVU11DRAFT_7044 [Chiua virens]|nr:hypothetical protein JVU11DRAFT_7044 [Chiua virens]